MKSMTASHDTAPIGSSVGPSSVIVSVSLSNPKAFPRCRNEILMGNFIMIPPLGGKRTPSLLPLRVLLGYVKLREKSTVLLDSVQQRLRCRENDVRYRSSRKIASDFVILPPHQYSHP